MNIGRIALGLVCCCFWANAALAGYIGESFLRVADVSGGWPGDKYHDWIKFEARDWIDTPTCAARHNNPNALVCDEKFWVPQESRLFFSGPWAPRQGAGKLAVALDKRSPALGALMDLCARRAKIPEVVYAESSEMSRRVGEVGPRPVGVPEFFEYTLKDVQLSCPVVAGAPEQALVLSFGDITWRNFQGEDKVAVSPPASRLPPRPTTGQSRTFVLTWIAPSGGHAPNECPQLNKEPTADDYFALLPKAAAARGKIELEQNGGLPALGQGIAFRGPDRLNVCALPGIVPDPGHVAPVSDVVQGFDLDEYQGKGALPAGVHRHKNYVSVDGRPGIDNQLYTVEGCVPGFRPEGNIPKIVNEMMRTGAITVLVDVSGIDDLKNDSDVSVTLLYGKDLLVKSADGSHILPNYTFRLAENPEFTQFFTHMQGRIENGVVMTEPLDEMTFQDGGQTAFKLFDARMRIEFLPDNKMKAVMGGYHDWRRRMTNWGRARLLEPNMRFQCSGIYNAFKRAADGLKDPVTGEFNGISVGYDIVGVRAFVPPRQLEALSMKNPR